MTPRDGQREIKFRAWHKEAKEMLSEKWDGQCLAFLSEGQPIEIMQFTGLKDKNGREIYEGDALKCEQLEVIVSWDDIECGFQFRDDDGRSILVRKPHSDQWEVIGNIYETPELLK